MLHQPKNKVARDRPLTREFANPKQRVDTRKNLARQLRLEKNPEQQKVLEDLLRMLRNK